MATGWLRIAPWLGLASLVLQTAAFWALSRRASRSIQPLHVRAREIPLGSTMARRPF